MTDDERVLDIVKRLERITLSATAQIATGRSVLQTVKLEVYQADIRFLLDRLAEAERRGRERAAEIAAQKCYELGLRVDQASVISLAIREEKQPIAKTLPTIEQMSGSIDFGGLVRYDNAAGDFVVVPREAAKLGEKG